MATFSLSVGAIDGTKKRKNFARPQAPRQNGGKPCTWTKGKSLVFPSVPRGMPNETSPKTTREMGRGAKQKETPSTEGERNTKSGLVPGLFQSLTLLKIRLRKPLGSSRNRTPRGPPWTRKKSELGGKKVQIEGGGARADAGRQQLDRKIYKTANSALWPKHTKISPTLSPLKPLGKIRKPISRKAKLGSEEKIEEE